GSRPVTLERLATRQRRLRGAAGGRERTKCGDDHFRRRAELRGCDLRSQELSRRHAENRREPGGGQRGFGYCGAPGGEQGGRHVRLEHNNADGSTSAGTSVATRLDRGVRTAARPLTALLCVGGLALVAGSCADDGPSVSPPDDRTSSTQAPAEPDVQ